MKKRKERKKPVLVARREREPEAVTAESGSKIHFRDVVVRRPVTFGWLGKAMSGTVVYVHPLGRYHIVEFEFPRGRKIRESFWGVCA